MSAASARRTCKRELDPTDYAGTSQIGKVSVERSFEEELHGRVGTADVLVNAHGRVMEVMDSEERASPGSDLRLTLDAPSQLAAAAAAQKAGAAQSWRIDPQNGEVLVMVSASGFRRQRNQQCRPDPQEYRELQQDPDRPLFNRALRGAYPPGSTIKPIIAMAGMHHRM